MFCSLSSSNELFLAYTYKHEKDSDRAPVLTHWGPKNVARAAAKLRSARNSGTSLKKIENPAFPSLLLVGQLPRKSPGIVDMKRVLSGWIAVFLVFGWGLPLSRLRAQERERVAPAAPAAGTRPNRGLQVRSVSVYGVYYSTTLPTSGGFYTAPTGLGADVALGGSAQIEWLHTGRQSTFSFLYIPSYTGRVRYSSWNALNHALAMNATRRIGRWSLGFSVTADFSNYEGFLFSPTVFSNAVAVSANFTDLSAAMMGRSSSNTQLSSILNGAAVVESPARTLLYGERMFTSAARTTLSYSYSPRFSVNFSGGGGRTQHVGENQNGVAQTRYLLPNTTSANASLGISYAYSPRTQFGVEVTTARTASDLYDGYTTTSTASLGRTLARRWLVQVHGGVGVMNPVRLRTGGQSTGPHPVGGGALGFRTYSHTFLGSYDYMVSDSYGAGANSTSTSSGSWRWYRPGGTWWLEATLSWQQLQGTSSQYTSSWRTTAGWGRALNAHLALRAEYAHLDYSGQVGTSFYSRSQHAARISLVWAPQAALPR